MRGPWVTTKLARLAMGVFFLVVVCPMAVTAETIVPVPLGNGLFCGRSTAQAAYPGPSTAAEEGRSSRAGLPTEAGTALEGGSLLDTLGEQRTLITLINFTDDTSTPYTTAQVDFEILDPANPVSTASYVQEVSYGRAWLTGTVLDWQTMPWDDGGICLLAYEGQTQTIVDELDPLVDFSLYDRWLIFIPTNPACPFSGYSSLGKVTFNSNDGTVQLSRAILNGFGAATNLLGAHELGHSLAGLQHSRDYECGADVIRDSCSPSGLGSLGDPYDVMGETSGGGHFTAPNKEVLGWLDTEVVEVPAPGGTYSLSPLETSAPGLKALRIPVTYSTADTARTRFYYVSYRKPLGFDAGFSDLSTDAAMIHVDSRAWIQDAVRRSWLLDMSPNVNADAASQAADSADSLLAIGETYTDAIKGISISVLGITDGKLDVSVTVSSYCGNGVVEPGIGEQCDDLDLGGATCAGIGRLDGVLSCAADCTLATETCGLPLCEEGHVYGPGSSCTATFLADAADLGLWRSKPTFTEVREDIWAKGTLEEIWISLMMTQRLDGWTWFHKGSLPFDTSALPDGVSILSAELLLKVVLAGGIANTHPDSADQLVLVQAALANPPLAASGDYPNFGALNSPAEGAARIDVGDELAINLVKSWPLNPTGMGWIDPTGWSVFGIRTGFDVDNIWFPGEEMDLKVQIRSSDSYTFGPRLVVDYAAAAPAGGAAGTVSQLDLDMTPEGTLALSWSPSCSGADSDYEIYEGTLGDFTSHAPRACSTGGPTTRELLPASGNSYYLVVPRSADQEGSYGTDSALSERPAATSACVPRLVGTCS